MAKEKILIVDDEKNILEEVKEFLVVEGYEVSIANNGQKGLEVFKEFQPDIVFMDIKMPGMDGIETFRYMKKIKPETKVVLITGLADEQTLDRAAGVSEDAIEGFIPKPFGFDELRECLEKLKAGKKSSSAFRFTQAQMEALDKVGKAGAENASASFSSLLGEKIELVMQNITVTPLSETERQKPETPVRMAGIMHKLSGQINGRFMVLFPWQSGLNLVSLGLGPSRKSKPDKFTDNDQSLLKSAGMVLGKAYLDTVKDLLKLNTQASPSELIFESKETILESLKKELGKTSEYLFSIQTEFAIKDADIKGCFLLLPELDSLKRILKSLGALS